MALHAKYGSSERIINHCRTVARVSEAVSDALTAKGRDLNRSAIVGGALLHDIGRNRTQQVDHGYVGANLLKDEGVDAVVVEIVKKHVGAGIEKEEAASLGFPPGDYIPRTLEEKVVCFADKMVGADRVRPFEEEENRFIRKGHDVERLRRLKSDIEEELGEDPERIAMRSAILP